MPNKKSAKKELRKSKKRAGLNAQVKKILKELDKKSQRALAGKSAEAKALIAQTIKAWDKAAARGLIKANTASRKQSRLQTKLNSLNKK